MVADAGQQLCDRTSAAPRFAATVGGLGVCRCGEADLEGSAGSGRSLQQYGMWEIESFNFYILD
ncbi:hypothetical protein [Microcoleus sp. FACHB-672]|uniref:hypothetical protein n=1 Tax=Microcoleus sp. FACHB-672 TaxID=2692825 RepID=UPI0016830A05|nr:hypothetical protein [Microcoleus sp. FACHB-672]MBD2041492.1 hypothetical protein [Microcoleus sp. FACHB-672]